MADYNPAHIPVYDMNSHPRGQVLLITNTKFQKYAPLNAGHSDRAKLVELFKKLDFTTVGDFINLEADQMKTKLQEVAKLDHSPYSCFVCCISSHGTREGIVGTDDEVVNIRDLTSPLCASKCESLAGKPKLFFVDACRGTRIQTGAKAVDESETDAVRILSDQEGPIPDEADFLLGYATALEYVAYEHQDKSKGSRFFSRLTEYLDKYAHVHDILEILTMVNNAVCSDASNRLQTPAPVFTLRKKLYLGLRNIRVLMVGPSVSGKSTVANAIFGEKKLAIQASEDKTQKRSDWQQMTKNGRRIEVTELPGMMSETESGFRYELTKALLAITPGPHVVFLCYRANLGFSANDNSYKWLQEFLGDHFLKFVVLVFCGPEPTFADDASKEVADNLNARHRKVVFKANQPIEDQQIMMLEIVDRVVRENGGCCFSNDKLKSLDKELMQRFPQRETSREKVRRAIVEGDDCGLKCLNERHSLLFYMFG